MGGRRGGTIGASVRIAILLAFTMRRATSLFRFCSKVMAVAAAATVCVRKADTRSPSETNSGGDRKGVDVATA